jgi:DNA-binding transcriptional regulator GbsR (MarR family)
MGSDEAGSSPPPLCGDEAILSQFIENMGLHFEEYDIPRIGGKILGLLLVASRPVSPEEMSEILQASRSSLSTNLRTLSMVGMIEQVSLPGERSDYYIFSEDTWQELLEIRQGHIQNLREIVQQGQQGLLNQPEASQRLNEALAWTSKLEKAYQTILQEWQSGQQIST